MEHLQVQEQKAPKKSDIHGEATWFKRGQSDDQTVISAPPPSKAALGGPPWATETSAASTNPSLLFVHNRGSAKWSVSRRAINAHVQKEQASRKKLAARQKLISSITRPKLAVQESEDSRMSILKLSNQRNALEKYGQLVRVSGSLNPLLDANLVPCDSEQCPSCGVEVSGLHSHGDSSAKSFSFGSLQHRYAFPGPTTISALNPFVSSVVPMTRRTGQVLDYWYNRMVPFSLPNKTMANCMNEFVTPLAVSEPLAMYALLSLASLHYEAGDGTSSMQYENGQRPDYLSYKEKTISLANKNVQSPSDAVSLTTIFATMCLIGLESCGLGNPALGNRIDIAAHVQGLQRLLNLRGGFHDIPVVAAETTYAYKFGAILQPFCQQRLISEAPDLLMLISNDDSAVYFGAASTRSPPVLQPPPNNLPRPNIPKELLHSVCRMGEALTSPPLIHLIHPSLLATVHQLADVMLFQTFTQDRSPMPISVLPLTLQDMNYVNLSTYHSIYNLLSFPFQDITIPPSIIPEIQEPLRVSLLIFYYANWRMHDSASPIFRTLSSQLKESLDIYISSQRGLFTYGTEPQTPFEVHSTLLWMLCLGAHASAGQRERPWFVLHVAVGRRVMGLQEWEELRDSMKGFFYSDEVYRDSFQAVWDESSLLVKGT